MQCKREPAAGDVRGRSVTAMFHNTPPQLEPLPEPRSGVRNRSRKRKEREREEEGQRIQLLRTCPMTRSRSAMKCALVNVVALVMMSASCCVVGTHTGAMTPVSTSSRR